MLKIWLPLTQNTNNQGLQIGSFTNSGATLSTAGPLGNCYSFDGTNDKLQGTWDCDTSEFSVCLWVYFNKIGVHVLDMRNTDNTGYQPIYVSSSGIQVGGSNSTYTYINFVPSTSTWYHICVTASSSKTSLYVNGEYYGATTSAYATNFNKTLDVHIGSRWSSTNWFGGYIADFRLYDNCLSAYEVSQIAKGLLLHYKYYNSNFSYIPDSSGFGRNGTIYGTLTTNDHNDGRYNKYIGVGSSANNYISITSPSSLTKTICFWIKATLTASTVAFADYKSHMGFGFNASSYIIATCGSWSKAMYDNSGFNSGEWNHIVTRWNSDSNDVELFINGVQQTTRTSTTNLWTHTTDTLMIGRRSSGTQMNASISDFRMYGTRLSDDDIVDLYQTSLKQMSDGTCRTFELYEDDTISKVQVKKNGLLICNEFEESSDGNKFLSTGAISDEFVER